MRKILILLFIFIFSIAAFGQKQSFEGFYKITFIDLFGTQPIVVGFFEIKNGDAISGSIKYENENLIFNGTVKNNGKFKSQTAEVDGVSFIIEGKIPRNGQSEKIEFTNRKVVKGNGRKQISENTRFGSIIASEPPKPESVYKDSGIADTGETFLKIKLANPLFGDQWNAENATVKVSNRGSYGNYYQLRLKDETDKTEQTFFATFQILYGQNSITVNKTATIGYSEKDKSDDKINIFMAIRSETSTGKIELIGEDEEKIVFKLVNVRFSHTSDAFVQIDGFIHALKTKND